jgi:SET domain-containing protein
MILPHDGVFTRLQRSDIHGLGVFAILDIPKGAFLFKGDEEFKTVIVNASDIKLLPASIKKLYEDFCPLHDGKYECPENFNQLTISWYLNSSKEPNVECRDNLLFYAARDIKPDEELTVDYETYSE